MSLRKPGLGRGLDALMAGSSGETVISADGDLRMLPVERLQRGPFQPRMDMRTDTLEELASSIRAQGVVQPIVVRPIEGGGFEIIAGERRWRASQLAGLHEVPAIVREVADADAVAMALIENIQRENLNPLEEAMALKRLIDEFDLTHQGAAEAVGRSRVAVSNLLRLIELNADVKELVVQRKLEMGHARALLGLTDAAQSEAAQRVAARGLSVRETERLVQRMQRPPPKPEAPARDDPDIRRLEESLAGRLGAKVRLQHGRKGGGKLVIEYHSLDELDGILSHIQ